MLLQRSSAAFRLRALTIRFKPSLVFERACFPLVSKWTAAEKYDHVNQLLQ